MRQFVRVTMGLFIVLLISGICEGQSGAPATSGTQNEQTALIQELLLRIDKMEKRIAELETKNDQAPPAVPIVGSVQQPAPQPTSGEAQASISHDHDSTAEDALRFEPVYPHLLIRGFADIQFAAQNAKNATGSSSGFQAGQFILHLSSPLSRRISYFGEISFTQTASSNFVNLERSIIRYDYNDAFKVSFGQFHAPTSYYNTAYHHGAWLQTSIARPTQIDFLTGPLPQHTLGFAAEGKFAAGPVTMGYMTGMGNGTFGSGAGDRNNNRSLFGEFYVRPGAIDGLQVGASIWTDKRPQAGRDYFETIAAGHIVLRRESPELIAEFSNTRHRDAMTGQTWNSQMGFLQLAYRLPWDEKKWKPYYLFEYINTPELEPVFGVRDLVGSTAGIRYDISDFAAFKLEYRNQKKPNPAPRLQGIFLQTAFTF